MQRIRLLLPSQSLSSSRFCVGCRYGDDLTGNKSAVRRLLVAAKHARHTLTLAEETTIELEALHAGVDFFATVTRGKVETLVEDLLGRCVGLLEGVWARAKARTAEAASGRPPRLLLSGGCCRTPKLQTMLKALLEDGQVRLCMYQYVPYRSK